VFRNVIGWGAATLDYVTRIEHRRKPWREAGSVSAK
jgi:hypothetical protein